MSVRFDIIAVARLALLAFLASLLVSCTGSIQPFSKAIAPTGKTPPAITITAMNVIPEDKAKVLFANLAVAAGKRDIAVVRGAFAGGYFMVGEFEILPTGTGVQLTYRWTVYNARKQVIHTIANTDTGRIGGADPWAGVDPDMLRRVADFTAESLATRLNQLGYATRLSGLIPPMPRDKAGPDAANDIDYETVYGPGIVAPPAIASLQSPVQPATPLPEKKRAAAKIVKANSDTPGAPDAGTKKVSAVAMTRVSGSPGSGNRDLLLAMRKVMKSAGWPVLTRPRADALTVTGKVKLDPPIGANQKVAVAWTVRTPDGKVLGTVRQANNVPSGSLNRGWGESAIFVSQAAAQGIFKLVKSAQ